VLALAGVVSEFRNPVGGDPASLLFAAGRILDGARLYTDLIDLNPPFTFLFHTLPVVASRVLGLDSILCFRVFVCGLVLLSGATLWRVLRRAPISAGAWHALVAAFLLGSLGLVVGFFGEREHIQFVLVFPYLALASIRAMGHPVSRRHSLWTGVLAGVGLALKVTAGLVPVLVLALLWLGRRERSDESLWALVTLAICTGGSLLWAPEYLAQTNALAPLYHGFARRPVAEILMSGPMAFTIWVAAAIGVLAWMTMMHRLVALIWLMAMLGFAASVAVQGKGFPYHYVPAVDIGVTLILLAIAAQASHPGKADALRRALAGVALLSTVSLPTVVAYARLVAPSRVVDEFSNGAYRMLEDVRPGTTVAMESSWLGDGFPLAVIRDLKLTGRYPHLWFVYPYDSTSVRYPRDIRAYTDSALTPVERALRRGAGEDLAAFRPHLMVVRSAAPRRVVLRYLCDDPVFRSAAASYTLIKADTILQLFRRDTSLQGAGACASS
jgi:hypothetical protein